MLETHFKLQFKLIGQGWASCEVEHGDQRAMVTASYLSDALGDLVSAAILLKSSGLAPAVSFAEEPGEYRWLLSYAGSKKNKQSRIRIRILAFDEWKGSRGLNLGTKGSKTIFDGLVETNQFYQALIKMLEGVIAEYGKDKYEDLWNGEHKSMPFPTAKMQRLIQLTNN